jgi:hypothetical protein
MRSGNASVMTASGPRISGRAHTVLNTLINSRVDRSLLNIFPTCKAQCICVKCSGSNIIVRHGISTPSEPTDLFFFERFRRDWTTRPKFSIPEPKNLDLATRNAKDLKEVALKFRCLMCPLNTSRLFILNGVRDHLRAK